MPEPQQLINLGKEVCEYLVHAFGTGNLTSDGNVYSASVVATSTDAADFAIVSTGYVRPFTGIGYGTEGTILEMEFSLTAGIHTSTVAADKVAYKWQAKEVSLSSTCWVDLMTWVSTAVGTTLFDETYSGYFAPTTNLEKVPFMVRLVMYNGAASSSSQAIGAAKNSSYIRVLYRVD